MDLSDETYLRTSYEPNAYDFKETAVEPYTELLDSPPLFSDIGFPVDAEYDDAALEGMLRSSPSTLLSLSTRRLVCQSVVVSVRQNGTTCWGQSGKHRLGLCSISKKSKFMPSARQELINTNFKQLEPKKFIKIG